MKLSVFSKMSTLMIALLLVFMMSSLAVTGCGDSGGDEDGDVDGDTDDGQDGDVEDSDGDTEDCTCETTDACCDGCMPINEEGACNDDNGCTLKDTCSEGVCVGSEEVICEASDQCHLAGECDPETGTCSDPAKEDGAECDDDDACTQTDVCTAGVCEGSDPVVCEALDDCHEVGECNPEDGECTNPNKVNGTACVGWGTQLGSGVCLEGECSSLDSCVLRTWDQPLDYPCNSNSDCASGLCALEQMDKSGAMFNSVCTKHCSLELDDCPAGMDCMPSIESGYGNICLPEDDTLPKDGSQQLYEPCNYNDDCASGICFGYNNSFFCTEECSSFDKANNCGSCGVCMDQLPKTNTKMPTVCLPEHEQGLGDLCVEDLDCSSMQICYENKCLQYCGFFKDDECPVDYGCEATSSIYGLLCVPDEDIQSKEKDEACNNQYECDEDTYCDVYPTGAMYIVVSSMDYEVGPLGALVNLFNNELPETTITLPETGSYYFYTAPAEGNIGAGIYYSIEITNGDVVSPTLINETELNDDYSLLDTPVALPAIINGSLPSFDIDVFMFEGTKGQTITFKLIQRQEEKKCLPAAKFGEACVENIHCQSNLCYNGTCNVLCGNMNMPQKGYGDCPAGYECVMEDGVKASYFGLDLKIESDYAYPICVLEETVNLGFGESCEKDNQCTSGHCLLGTCTKSCDISIGGSCGSEHTCTNAVDAIPVDRKVSNYFCVANDQLDIPFGEACSYRFQCDNTLCYDGKCNHDGCVHDTKDAQDCPAGTLCTNVGQYGDSSTKASDQYTCIDTDELEKANGEACLHDHECAFGLCYHGFCNVDCGALKPNPCPDGTSCMDIYGVNTCHSDTHLTKQFGETCYSHYDCESEYCYKGKCNLYCDIAVKEIVSCPDDFSCVQVQEPLLGFKSDGTIPACIASDLTGKVFGDACTEDWECASGICHLDYCTENCAALKADCVSGYTCKQRYSEYKAPEHICIKD